MSKKHLLQSRWISTCLYVPMNICATLRHQVCPPPPSYPSHNWRHPTYVTHFAHRTHTHATHPRKHKNTHTHYVHGRWTCDKDSARIGDRVIFVRFESVQEYRALHENGRHVCICDKTRRNCNPEMCVFDYRIHSSVISKASWVVWRQSSSKNSLEFTRSWCRSTLSTSDLSVV